RPASARHIVDQNLSLLGPLGISPAEPEFPLPAFDDMRATTFSELAARGMGERREFAVLLPSTRGRAKQWPPRSFSELAAGVVRRLSLPVLLLGGPGEENLLDQIRVGAANANVTSWAPGPI